MTDRENLNQIVKRAAHSCLPSNTQELHINLLVTELLSSGVVVREKGEWVETVEDWVMCSVCGDEWNGKVVPIEEFYFCPNCGSDMRAEEQNRAREGENG